jgi:hypothetical protein
MIDVDPFFPIQFQRLAPQRIVTDRRDEHNVGSGPACGNRLVGPFAPRRCRERVSQQRLTRNR